MRHERTTNQTGPAFEPVAAQRDHRPDDGYTLIELILVVMILGVLAAVVVMSVGGVSTEAAESGCGADQRQLGVAVESYFAEHGGSQLPATGAGQDQYEQTLVAVGLLKGVSEFHNLDADGAITPQAGARC